MGGDLQSQGTKTPLRAALYVDGFNLYHPIRRMGDDHKHFKWACLWDLGLRLTAPRGQKLVKVVFCTAVPSSKQGEDRRTRHIRFNDAQRARGVTILEGHYVPEPIEVNGIPTGDQKWTEKQTDINVALTLITDGYENEYDIALLLSADTDQVATARVFTEKLRPLGKTLVGVAPPDRAAPIGYGSFKVPSIVLKKSDIESCIMPERVEGNGLVVYRPNEYSPPDGWIHPNDRPKGKAPKPPKGIKL